MKKSRMALMAVACVTAGFAINVAMDGGGPPRVRMRAEASPFEKPAGMAAPSPPHHTLASLRRAAASPLHIEDLERELTAADPAKRDLVLQKLLPEWVAQNPEAAARFAELQTEPALRELAIRRVALLWGALDAERAVNWAGSLPDATERDATLIDIANGLSSVDPARGVELREPFTVSTQPDSALSNLVQQWAGYDFDAALTWTNARAPGAQRDDLLQRLIYVRAAAGDPAAAARLVTESSLTGQARTAAIASVAQEWARRDGNAALEWLRSLDRVSSEGTIEELSRAAGPEQTG
jgi:hypothetical protein